MNIPPFPAHELAKLVLGYLAEEQLMTAYDEFLSASPYLDAMKNEYDWIFMTSLKNIISDYRAVKIYVESCKPYSLRRRLIGCTNLLELVKFLIQNVDVSKLQHNESQRDSLDKSTSCAICNSLKLANCVCKSRILSQTNETNKQNMETTVETTSLEDLPGNGVKYRKKQVKTLSKDSRLSQTIMNSESNLNNFDDNDTPSFDHSLPTTNNDNVPWRSVEMIPPEVFNLSTRTSNGSVHNIPLFAPGVKNKTYRSAKGVRTSMEGTFQDFSLGFQGDKYTQTNVPDSSTSETINQTTSKQLYPLGNGNMKNLNTVSKARIFLTVGTINTSPALEPSAPVNQNKPDSKVTILSDVKVNKFPSKMPAVLQNATSTPMMHMQTILINDTPVYKPQPPMLGSNRNFTKDEIMAMPTIIVVPTSGESQVTSKVQPEVMPAPSQLPPPPPMQPLVIDVTGDPDSPPPPPPPPPPPAPHPAAPAAPADMPPLDRPNDPTEMLVKTVDTKMVSAPKEMLEGKNTPEGLPPLRKSSSTPRRTTHVRVLDFTTPRRILQEAVPENAEADPVDAVSSGSLPLPAHAEPGRGEEEKTKESEASGNCSGSSKENEKCPKIVPRKKHWDADLRASAVPNRKEDIPTSRIQPRCRPRLKKPNESKSTSAPSDSKKKTKSGNGVKNTSKINTEKSGPKKVEGSISQKVEKVEKPADEPLIIVDDDPDVPVKPTINIVSGQNWGNQENKPRNDEPEDTPEMDRLCLQNAIGTKLNLSDLFDTPYKQVLYDIQMETPRFLAPDLPGEPLSDIKIMNIPTPQFLDTPKPALATPSYSSRPTDYSSGSSYYKPDEQDYISVTDLGYPPTGSNETATVDPPVVDVQKGQPEVSAKTRPVRKCAKNVSYYQSSLNRGKESNEKPDVSHLVTLHSESENNINKDSTKEAKRVKEIKSVKEKKQRKPKIKDSINTVEEPDEISDNSDSVSVHSASENDVHKDTTKEIKYVNEIISVKEVKSGKEKKQRKPKIKDSKKQKTPVKKKDAKTFMKIKPRRVTPTKEIKTKGKKRSEDIRKRTTSRESNEVTPVAPAPTKSRRKSSTPRKLPCTKVFNSESSGHDSPDTKSKGNVGRDTPTTVSVQDSDTEQVQLHWSDEGSREAMTVEAPTNISGNETEDISKIKEYIASELHKDVATSSGDRSGNLQIDLIKRGFDVETAKIIERDLLDSPANVVVASASPKPLEPKPNEPTSEKALDSDTSSNLKIVQESNVDGDEEEDDIELTVSECNEGSANYTMCSHDDLKDLPRAPIEKFKENFIVEICPDDTAPIRLRATPISTIFEIDPVDTTEVEQFDERETATAVDSISNIDKLYTPMKDQMRAQVYDIFDSTLTSLDTPLKANSPGENECDSTMAEDVMEVEEVKERPDNKKRKRINSVESTDSTASPIKRAKPEAEYLLNSANIQNIDIEIVLSKLHGP